MDKVIKILGAGIASGVAIAIVFLTVSWCVKYEENYKELKSTKPIVPDLIITVRPEGNDTTYIYKSPER